MNLQTLRSMTIAELFFDKSTCDNDNLYSPIIQDTASELNLDFEIS